jgi:arylformamidase
MTRFFDVTLPIRDGMVVYPGDPEVRVRTHSAMAEGDDANVSVLSLGSHTGTHLDAPKHFFDEGQTVEALPLDVLIGPARVVELPDDVTAIGARELERARLDGEPRVLFKTRNGRLLDRDEFSSDYAYLTADAGEYLAEAGVRLVGIDYLSVEPPDADEPVVHRTLLGRDVIIVEGLDLRQVPPGRYELLCLPLKVAGIDGAPLRAVLRSLD